MTEHEAITCETPSELQERLDAEDRRSLRLTEAEIILLTSLVGLAFDHWPRLEPPALTTLDTLYAKLQRARS